MLAALAVLAAVSTAPPPGPDTLGRYAIKARGKTVCVVTFTYEPTVGGEVEPAKACPAPFADAARWFDDGAGGFTLFDPIRHRLGKVVEDEAGLTLILDKGGARYDVFKLDTPRARTDAERATGWWSVRGEDPSKVVCRIELRPGGAVGPAAACPASVKPYGGGRWTADTHGVILHAATGPSKALRWSDAVTLEGARGAPMLTHD